MINSITLRARKYIYGVLCEFHDRYKILHLYISVKNLKRNTGPPHLGVATLVEIIVELGVFEEAVLIQLVVRASEHQLVE